MSSPAYTLPDLKQIQALSSAPAEVKQAFITLCEKVLFPQAVQQPQPQGVAQPQPSLGNVVHAAVPEQKPELTWQQRVALSWKERIAAAVLALPVHAQGPAIISLCGRSNTQGVLLYPLDKPAILDVLFWHLELRNKQMPETFVAECVEKINAFKTGVS